MHPDADATQQTARLGVGAARREAVPVGERKALVERGFELPAVVDVILVVRLERHLRRLDHVAPAHGDRVDAHFVRRLVDQPLQEEARLWLAGAAIGLHRRRIGEHRARDRNNMRNTVRTRIADSGIVRRDAAGFHEISPDIELDRGAKCQHGAVAVERKLTLGDLMASVRVAEKALGAIRPPFDRTPQFARRPGHQDVLGIDAFHAEGAADVERANAD
jgi:hypothetical protein